MDDSVREKGGCRESGQQVPYGIAEVASVIYNSLAKCYAETIEEIESMPGIHYDTIHIVGGGANADYLNRLTAAECKRKVIAGPTEATAIGNLAAQMIAQGNGHYHPTEVVSDKIPAMLCFYPEIALHITRSIRWDSDHVVLFDDETKEMAKEIIRCDGLDRVYMALDYFETDRAEFHGSSPGEEDEPGGVSLEDNLLKCP